MQFIRLSHLVADNDLIESWICFFKIAQRCVEDENKMYNWASTPKKSKASVEGLAISTTAKFSEWLAHGTNRTFEFN